MLGFSLQKLVVLGLIIAAVWYGFKLLGRVEARRKENARVKQRDGEAVQRPDNLTAELSACPGCGTFVPPEEIVGGHCGSCEARGRA